MAGGYTHLTVVNWMTDDQWIPELSKQGKFFLRQWFKYCELGAVSPDYPYLTVLDSGQGAWADRMHNFRAGELLKCGIRRLAALPEGGERERCFAWLLGYAAHVGTDLTIHPVVNLKVGDYNSHKDQHRICEMNQDLLVYGTLNMGSVLDTRHLAEGIARCTDPADPDRLDPAIAALWSEMLTTVYPQLASSLTPKFDTWHNWFQKMIGVAATRGGFIGFSRHLPFVKDYLYPKDFDPRFTQQLATPEGPMDFTDLLHVALRNVGSLWKLIDQAVFSGDNAFETVIGPEWDLDTGEDRRGSTAGPFWKGKPLMTWELPQ